MRSWEFGVGNSELGIRSAEGGMRKIGKEWTVILRSAHTRRDVTLSRLRECGG